MRGLEALLPLFPPQVGAGSAPAPWSATQSRLLHLLLLLLLHLSTTSAQFCTGTETFEKVEMRMTAVMMIMELLSTTILR